MQEKYERASNECMRECRLVEKKHAVWERDGECSATTESDIELPFDQLISSALTSSARNIEIGLTIEIRFTEIYEIQLSRCN